MLQAGIDLLFLPISGDLEYLTGIPRREPSFGNVSYRHGWLAGAFLRPEKDPVVVLPRMITEFELPDGPAGEVVIVSETDDGDAVLARIIPNGDVLILAVHSEKLLIDDGAGDAARNRLTGTVTDVVYQGESLRIFLVLPDGTTLSLRQPSHHEAYRRIPPLGGSLTVTLHPEDTIIVPKASE